MRSLGDCLFCKIINKEISSDIVFENEYVLAFKDIKKNDSFRGGIAKIGALLSPPWPMWFPC